MEAQLIEMLLQAVPVLKGVLSAVGALVVLIGVIIKFTPSKADDAALEAIKNIPIIGGILAALVGKAPIQEKSEG